MSLSQRYFATFYDSLHGVVEGRLVDHRRQTAGKAQGEVLEIGGGSGANLRYFPTNTRLTVAEPNPHMVARLRRRAAELERPVRVVPDRGEALSFPDSSFDSVVTSLVLCMVDDLDQVLGEARRVLKPGGAFYFYEHVASRHPFRRWWEDRLNPTWRFLTTGCNLNRDIEGAIRSAGFRDVEVTAFDLSVGLPLTLPNTVGVARM